MAQLLKGILLDLRLIAKLVLPLRSHRLGNGSF